MKLIEEGLLFEKYIMLIIFNVLKIGRFLGDEIEYIIKKNLIIV